jgi:hypothetical protein
MGYDELTEFMHRDKSWQGLVQCETSLYNSRLYRLVAQLVRAPP